MEIGIYSFVERTPDPDTGRLVSAQQGWPPPTRQHFENERTPRGALLVGSPQEVIDKILFQHDLFAHDRFLTGRRRLKNPISRSFVT